ncbi:MAG: hypothetical protein ACLQPV_00560 [Vulcanimicrobiaceae bacterium]
MHASNMVPSTSAPRPVGKILLDGILAGLAGGIVFDLYLWLTTVLPSHGSMASVWGWTASAVFGNGVLNDPRYATVGLAVHLAVSVGWAVAYAWVAATRPAVNERWQISGVAYGLIVYMLMQIVLLVDDKWIFPPSPNAFLNGVAAHAIFFGPPVAYVVSRLQRA